MNKIFLKNGKIPGIEEKAVQGYKNLAPRFLHSWSNSHSSLKKQKLDIESSNYGCGLYKKDDSTNDQYIRTKKT